MIFTILEASKAQVKTLQNHDVIRLMKIILKRVKRILSIQKKQDEMSKREQLKEYFSQSLEVDTSAPALPGR